MAEAAPTAQASPTICLWTLERGNDGTRETMLLNVAKNQQKTGLAKPLASPVVTGRDEKIRTSGPLNPIQVRYQTALHPVLLLLQNSL